VVRFSVSLAALRVALAQVQAPVVHQDVPRAADVERLVSQAEATLGPVDVLVNNAGVVLRKSFLESTEADYDSAHQRRIR